MKALLYIAIIFSSCQSIQVDLREKKVLEIVTNRFTDREYLYFESYNVGADQYFKKFLSLNSFRDYLYFKSGEEQPEQLSDSVIAEIIEAVETTKTINFQTKSLPFSQTRLKTLSTLPTSL